VRIGTGRDAADASFATIIGEAAMTYMSVWADQTTPNPLSNGTLEQSAVSTNN